MVAMNKMTKCDASVRTIYSGNMSKWQEHEYLHTYAPSHPHAHRQKEWQCVYDIIFYG